MMALTNMLSEVEMLIAQEVPADGGAYTLYVKCKKLCLGKTRFMKKTYTIIARFSTNEINRGVLSTKWDLISCRLLTLQREELLCPGT